MKLSGIAGRGRGKLGNMIFSDTGGSQIVRQYNPIVRNPNTRSQVAHRAKFKLMSQVAAACAPYIAMKRYGNVSPRNRFIERNFPNVSVEGNEAVTSIAALQFTDGVTAISEVSMMGWYDEISVQLVETQNWDAVVYIIGFVFNGTLSLVRSAIVREPSVLGTYPHIFDNLGSDDLLNDNIVVYAYGIRDARGVLSKYGNSSMIDATQLASLVISKSQSVSGSVLSRTSGAFKPSNTDVVGINTQLVSMRVQYYTEDGDYFDDTYFSEYNGESPVYHQVDFPEPEGNVKLTFVLPYYFPSDIADFYLLLSDRGHITNGNAINIVRHRWGMECEVYDGAWQQWIATDDWGLGIGESYNEPLVYFEPYE